MTNTAISHSSHTSNLQLEKSSQTPKGKGPTDAIHTGQPPWTHVRVENGSVRVNRTHPLMGRTLRETYSKLQIPHKKHQIAHLAGAKGVHTESVEERVKRTG